MVEDAEATAVSGEGMVCASGQMTGQTVFQSQTGRQQRTPDSKKGALHQRCGDRKSDASLRLAIQTISGKRLVIGTVMNQFQQAPRHRKRSVHLNITG